MKIFDGQFSIWALDNPVTYSDSNFKVISRIKAVEFDWVKFEIIWKQII